MATRRASTASPPGPSEAVSMAEIRSDPLSFLRRLVAEYGDVTRHHVEDWNVVTLNRPDLVRAVLRNRGYVKRGTPDEAMLRPLLGEGLLTSDGDVWKRQRRVAQPAFEQRRIESMGALIVEETQAHAGRWTAAGREQPVRLDHELSNLTLAIVTRAIVGSELADLGGRFGEMVDIANRFMGHFDPGSSGGLDSEQLAFFKAVMYLDELVAALVADRRRNGGSRGDLLDRWLGSGFDEREIRDQVVTMLMAGHETTAKALTWTLYLLDRHPAHDAALRDELSRVLGGRLPVAEDLPRLPLVAGTIQEALRLFPPVWLISRLALADDTVGGYEIPGGSLVCASPYLLHRHPDHWPDPERFDPGRFAAARAQERHEFAYVPFGGGPRRCIGAHFALFEAQLVLATIRQSTDVQLVAGHPVEPEALVTLRPKDGILATVRTR